MSRAMGCRASKPPSISNARGKVAMPAKGARRRPTIEVRMMPVIEQDQNRAWARNKRKI
jgi:hypothetical protein